jgi:glycosyltransferase involved in cell wall biosynthesis
MNILMMTNTYAPHVGGVARSVESFTRAYGERGHRVLVVAPEYEGRTRDEPGVVRVPAIQNFNGSDFAVVIPLLRPLGSVIRAFEPDIVHSHHPFLIGATAVRAANVCNVPLVFTYHTMYEDYTHYVPADSETLKRFVVALSVHYANLCDLVFAPSESVAEVLKSRGVESPIEVVPTGVDVARFARGSAAGFRAAAGIPANAAVIGHVGRLAPEKNLGFLARSVARAVARSENTYFMVVGKGPAESAIRDAFNAAGCAGRLLIISALKDSLLMSAYHAMDVFAFASRSETQGMVLVEAMAAGVPVVALDANGTREVVEDGSNGRLVKGDSEAGFAAAVQWVLARSPAERRALGAAARRTADRYSLERMAERALDAYSRLVRHSRLARPEEYDMWMKAVQLIKAEWDVIRGVGGAVGSALAPPGGPEGDRPN